MSEIYFEKKELRKKIREKGKSLTLEYCKKADRDIYERVITLDEYEKAKVVFVFISIHNEPSTKEIIEDAWRKGKTVAAPVCISKTQMEARKIQSFDDLEEGYFGIKEPKDGLEVIPKESIDFALVPCVSSDRKGNRLGYGGGFYDRYFENTDFFKCMICRRKLLSEHIPKGIHDIKMDKIIYDLI